MPFTSLVWKCTIFDRIWKKDIIGHREMSRVFESRSGWIWFMIPGWIWLGSIIEADKIYQVIRCHSQSIMTLYFHVSQNCPYHVTIVLAHTGMTWWHILCPSTPILLPSSLSDKSYITLLNIFFCIIYSFAVFVFILGRWKPFQILKTIVHLIVMKYIRTVSSQVCGKSSTIF